MSEFASRRTRRFLFALVVIFGLGSVVFGLRSYHAFLLLRSAYDLGAPRISTVRPWMTLRYLAATYFVPSESLRGRLGLPRETGPDTSLRALAIREGVSPILYVQRVQQALVESDPGLAAGIKNGNNTAWLGSIGEELLAALIVYGYPVLGLTLLIGAIGLPVPTGLSTVVAGSLLAAGKLSWAWTGAVALTASVLGDAAGYALGRSVAQEILERRARWLGYTVERRKRVVSLFNRWGGLGVLLSRTLVSHLSSVVNVVAGASRYRPYRFLVLTVIGRFIWTSAYLGLGYAAGADLEAASSLLANLSLLLACLATMIVAALLAAARVPTGSRTNP